MMAFRMQVEAAFGSGRQYAGPRTRRVFGDEERGRGHGERALSHERALSKEEEAL
jgi:hypothetical protein